MMTLIQILQQYKNDLKHPVTDSGSRQRRLEAIDEMLARLNKPNGAKE